MNRFAYALFVSAATLNLVTVAIHLGEVKPMAILNLALLCYIMWKLGSTTEVK